MNTKLIEALRRCLADVFNEYTHAHGFHWNVVGKDFPQLHEFFQEIYEDVYSSIDPIAEILRKLDAPAPFRLSEFVSLRGTTEKNPSDALGMVRALYELNHGVILNLMQAFKEGNAVNQQGACNFIAERIDMHQKWAWQLKSTLV